MILQEPHFTTTPDDNSKALAGFLTNPTHKIKHGTAAHYSMIVTDATVLIPEKINTIPLSQPFYAKSRLTT